MAKKYRVGLIGFAHMHMNHLANLFHEHPQVELAACADTVADRAELREGPYTRAWNVKYAMEKLGVGKAYGDYRELLAKERVEIVICCSENAKHAEVTEACAGAGAQVLVEKPMASSLGHALRMVRAAEHAGTKVLVNWPTTWDPAVRLAKKLIDDGVIGRIIQVKWRAGHTGPLGPGEKHPGVPLGAEALKSNELAATWWHHDSTGGGAMLDYCCYGCMLARWFIGEPAVAAVGMRANLNSQWSDSDDNGAMIVRFPAAMALMEASWTQLDYGVPGGPIVYGQTGVLVMETRNEKHVIRIERGRGKTEVLEAEALPAGRDQVSSEMIHSLETGEAVHPTLDVKFNLDAMAILDAGWRASNSGKMEMVDNGAWRVG